jgi:hypothetical protein
MKRCLFFLAIAGIAAFAQQTPGKLVIPFTDPAKAKMLKVDVLNGSIHVQGYTGKDVIVEIKEGADRGGERASAPAPAGMRRIGTGGGDIRAEELDNIMKIHVGPSRGSVALSIQVPANCSLNIKTINDGTVVVEGIQGEIEANNLNGPVTLTNVAGTVIAHSLNGKVLVSMDRVESGKPMSFSTLNGDIDVTLPADIKANVKMKSDHGEIMSDYEIVSTAASQVEGGQRDSKGMYKVSISRGLNGTINGGGQPLQFTTMNGTIYIRKKGAAAAR